MGHRLLNRLAGLIDELESAGFKVSAAYVQMAADAVEEAIQDEDLAPRHASSNHYTSNQ